MRCVRQAQPRGLRAILLDSCEDLDSAPGIAAARAYAALPERHRSDFLIEEFQSGTEYSAEGVFVEAQPQVITLTTKHLMEEADCFIERGHVIPALLPEPVSRRARQVVEAALRALGLVYGVFHVEFWIDGDRIV